MLYSSHTCQFSLFGKKVHMFSEKDMGVVIEKEPHVVCVYGTDNHFANIYCAIPLCHPKYLKGQTFSIQFYSNHVALVQVSDMKIVIDFESHKVCNNKGIQNYGSDVWGEDVSIPWNEPVLE